MSSTTSQDNTPRESPRQEGTGEERPLREVHREPSTGAADEQPRRSRRQAGKEAEYSGVEDLLHRLIDSQAEMAASQSKINEKMAAAHSLLVEDNAALRREIAELSASIKGSDVASEAEVPEVRRETSTSPAVPVVPTVPKSYSDVVIDRPVPQRSTLVNIPQAKLPLHYGEPGKDKEHVAVWASMVRLGLKKHPDEHELNISLIMDASKGVAHSVSTDVFRQREHWSTWQEYLDALEKALTTSNPEQDARDKLETFAQEEGEYYSPYMHRLNSTVQYIKNYPTSEVLFTAKKGLNPVLRAELEKVCRVAAMAVPGWVLDLDKFKEIMPQLERDLLKTGKLKYKRKAQLNSMGGSKSGGNNNSGGGKNKNKNKKKGNGRYGRPFLPKREFEQRLAANQCFKCGEPWDHNHKCSPNGQGTQHKKKQE